jgi:hypothetical protein
MAMFDGLLIVLRGSNGRRYKTLRLNNLSTKIEIPLSACSVKMKNSRRDGTDCDRSVRVRLRTGYLIRANCTLHSSLLQ